MSFADPFREMAERIDRTPEAEFSGAIVIVGPDGKDAISFLVNDKTKDIPAFWSMIGGKLSAITAQLKESIQQASGWGGRR